MTCSFGSRSVLCGNLIDAGHWLGCQCQNCLTCWSDAIDSRKQPKTDENRRINWSRRPRNIPTIQNIRNIPTIANIGMREESGALASNPHPFSGLIRWHWTPDWIIATVWLTCRHLPATPVPRKPPTRQQYRHEPEIYWIYWMSLEKRFKKKKKMK